MSKKAYLIESLAPLVFRSAKPFGSIASAQDATYPLPSATAGLVRALSIEQNQGRYTDYKAKLLDADYQKILSIRSQGPLLVRFNPEQLDDYTILLPKPANALYFEDKKDKRIHLVRLAPQMFDSELCGSDLPDGLLPVQMQQERKGKPQSGVAYWSLNHFLAWQNGEDLDFEDVEKHGLKTLPIDIRTHVKIDAKTSSSEEGKLFQTASLDLNHTLDVSVDQQAGLRWQAERYGFILFSQQDLKPDLATLGGERRLSYFKPVSTPDFLQPKADLLEQINQAKGFCLSLLSPNIFAQGYLPAWIDQDTLQGKLPNSTVEVKLTAVAIDRWLPVSGWDSVVWKPKATRKAVSAGSVYWFKLLTPMDHSTLKQIYAASLADHPQDQNDGFGLSIISAWFQS